MDINAVQLSKLQAAAPAVLAHSKGHRKKLKKLQKLKTHACAICGTTKNLLRCSRCKSIYYCGTSHQYLDWSKHKLDCNKQNQLVLQLTDDCNAMQLSSSACLPITNASLVPPAYVSPEEISTVTASTDISSDLVMLENNDNEILYNDTETVIQPSGDNIYLNSMQTNFTTTTLEQMHEPSASINFTPNVAADNDINMSYASSYQTYQNNTITPAQQQFSPIQYNKIVECSPISQFSNHANNQREKSTSHQIDTNIANGLFVESANERRYEELCRNITNDMNEYGLSVVDDFLGMEKGLQILNEVHRMYAAGVFKDGQLVNKVKSEQDLRTIRGDKITWVKGVEQDCSNIGYLINQIDTVICRANTMKNNGKLGDYSIRERTKAMVACYPGSGAHYVMHVDNPNKDGRVITAIYYLNINWDAERSGGVLRIFPKQTKSVADIEPKFDRLIFFWSDKRNPHEVQPAHRTRYAITVWYFDANEREAALSRCKSLPTTPVDVFDQF